MINRGLRCLLVIVCLSGDTAAAADLVAREYTAHKARQGHANAINETTWSQATPRASSQCDELLVDYRSPYEPRREIVLICR